ncbi:transcriptional regulator [Sphaerochaeta pleomorpha str. Grapes]|uniref:Transcriptional regulator n=1 Tax=Sphaerochaeta pleomorpha (strain ATCC BAA-1885 / DSM 22778 / Grapes) TaxID=158190 RepID=G8QUQ1_SPHPG|nr:LacI family DNA-binding transcriptional regulator [Sphaerochaeta pleomorpha]AEV30359.1 transcriptional regulator [Sphaerochaeta pleomorpha str. Grapes]
MEKKEQATIKDVAKLAGVSIATVSRVLNKLGVVNLETEQRVTSAVKSLHYQRNAVARSLKMKRTKSIGIIAPELSNTFFSEIVEQLEKLLAPMGYALLFCSSQNSIEEEKRKLSLLLERNVDALVVIPTSDVGDHFTSPALGSTPMVMVDRQIPNLDCDVVLTDNRLGAYDITCSLIREGFTSIGFLGGDRHVHTSVERLHGYYDAMQEFGLPVDPEFIMLGGMTQQAGYQLMGQALAKEHCPKVFFMVNDMVHIGASSYLLSECSQTVQDSMAFSTFDYLYYAPLLKFCHYAVAQPLEEIGEVTAKLLLKRIGGDYSDFPCKVVIEPSIRVLTNNGGIVTDGKARTTSHGTTPRIDKIFS